MKKIIIILVLSICFSCGSSKNTNNNVSNKSLNGLNRIASKLIFKQGTDVLIGDYEMFINQISSLIKLNYNDTFLEISGHTDSVGSKETNLLLSQKRAITIKNLLVLKGCDATKLKAVGYGELRPIEDNQTKEGRQLNRRIEIRIISN
jgi:outer membrane protein OmpA-like peptidoglycan-associated protein